MIRTLRPLGAILTILYFAVGAARADTYYVVVFGAESTPPRPKYSHSWAAFVRLPGCEVCGPPVAPLGPPEVVVISWLPRAVELHPNRLLPEAGCNFDLAATFQIVLSQCEHVWAWGPYQIDCRLFERAKEHACRLQSGEVRYKVIDFLHNPLNVSNCIHALTVFNTENHRLRVGRTNFGDVASYYVADSYRAWIVDPCQVHCWVADLLGLGQYPIRWRTLEQGRPRIGD